ncbi:MAG TPA: hypothetical protein VFU21_16425 [Kofleriaceae bacterium]|nr:hypothetical protein [Kofleriaceae bacterium]
MLRALLLLALATGACMRPAKRPTGATGGAEGGLLPQDQSFTLKDVEVRGVAFEPQALGLPVMTQVTGRGRPNLDRLRRQAARKTPDPGEVQQLATALWQEAAAVAASDAPRATQLREEARAALRKLRASLGAKADAVTLEMLAAAELWLGDVAAAAGAYDELVRRFPRHQGARAFQIWLALLRLRQNRVADAAALVKGWRVDELGDMGAYVLAWVSFLAGDGAAARGAIARALASWREQTTRPVVERDLLLILARSGSDADAAGKIVAEASDNDTQKRYVLMFKLSEAFEKDGRYAEAARALDIVVEDVVKGQMPPDDLVGFRFRQADYAFRLNEPGQAAERAIQAHQALKSCAARCPATTGQAVTERIVKLAQFSHTVYAKSQDPRHFQAAQKLYRHYLQIPDRSDAETVRGYLRSLEETRSAADPNAGKHDAEVMLNVALARREVLAACYESALMRERALEGSIKLSVEVDHTGKVAGAASDPAAGVEGLARAAGCAVDRARAWTFPSRTVPGKTVLEIPIQFRVQLPPGAAAPAPAAPPPAKK